MGMLRAVAGTVYIMAALVLIAACTAGKTSQTRQVGDYFVTVTTDPPKLEVGKDAEVTAHIGKDDEGVERCRAGFRQYMPAHQLTTDHSMHVLEDIGQGLYRARGSEFSMGGDWELEFQFNCGDGLKTVVFPYNLVWM
jgi:YtkA-like